VRRDDAAQHDTEHRSHEARGEERAEHRAAHARREHRSEQRHARRAVGGFAKPDDAARDKEVTVVLGVRTGDRRNAPDERHQEDALDAAPAVGEQRQRDGSERNHDRHDRDETSQLAIRKRPLRLEVRKHRDDDLAVDAVDDHQREHNRKHRPRIPPRWEAVLQRVVIDVVDRNGH
jgi:hypothetical protein